MMKAIPFWDNVKLGNLDECWPWIKSRKKDQYGKKTYGNAWRNGRSAVAHKVAWEMTNGPVPCGMLVCHKCDNPPCCNPAHLFLGTYKENSQDSKKKGRNYRQFGEKHWNAHFTEAEIVDMRSRFATQIKSESQLASEFGITKAQLLRIVHGQSWKFSGGPISPMYKKEISPETVKNIFKECRDGISQSAIAKRHGTCQSVISRIVNRMTHKNVGC